MLALFSTGPVGFGDAAGRTNVSLLRAMALDDGTLVKPSRPITAADVTVMSSAWERDVSHAPRLRVCPLYLVVGVFCCVPEMCSRLRLEFIAIVFVQCARVCE